MSDTEITNLDYPKVGPPEYSPEYFRGWIRKVIDRLWERIEEEKELFETHDYRQTWLISKKGWESLPENPIWQDMIRAGGQFMGYNELRRKKLRMRKVEG